MTLEARSRLSMDSATLDELLTCARRAAERAYAPYSAFPVGAAVLASDGSVFAGCNVENASIGLTICAEQAAMSAAVAAGHYEIQAVAVSAPKSPGTTPCGACRQFLNEFLPHSCDLAVVLDDGVTGTVVWLSDLLPGAFGPQNLDSSNRQSISGTDSSIDDGH